MRRFGGERLKIFKNKKIIDIHGRSVDWFNVTVSALVKNDLLL